MTSDRRSPQRSRRPLWGGRLLLLAFAVLVFVVSQAPAEALFDSGLGL